MVRGGYNPLKPPSTNDILFHDLIGTNSGNVLYLMGVLRSIWSSDVDVDVDQYLYEQGRYTESDINIVNANYDAYLVPLADAFRDGFVNGLNRLASFIEKLTIPAHVISVGMRADYEPKFLLNPELDNAVKRFMNAVLNHSPIVGVRGEITGEYLCRLGYLPEKHYTVIGCPSMYILGDQLTRRKTEYNINSSLSLCFRPGLININENLLKLAHGCNNWNVVVQNLNEIKCIHLGMSDHSKAKKFFYASINDQLICDNRIKGFICAGDWIRYMREKDFSLGGLFHGSVAGFLGGASTVVIPSDARMRELCAYHSLPSLPAKDWSETSNLNDVLDKVDLDSHLSVVNVNFLKYRHFLNQIGIESVWDKKESPKTDLLSFSRPIENCIKKKATDITSIWLDYFPKKHCNNVETKPEIKDDSINNIVNTDRIPVFTWHRIVNDNIKQKYFPDDEWVVSVSELACQFDWLADHGYKTIHLKDLGDWYSGEREYDNKTVALAFDDGYIELFYLVWPLLQKYGFCATSFIIGSKIKKDDSLWIEEKQSFLSYSMINIIKTSDSSIDFQSHSWNLHEKINGKSKVFSCDSDMIKQDFEEMKKLSDYSCIAYPYGAYTDELLEQVKNHGYKLGFVFGNIKNNDFVSRRYDRYLLPRIKMGAGMMSGGLTKWLDC